MADEVTTTRIEDGCSATRSNHGVSALHVADYSTTVSISMRENPPTTKKEVWAFYATDAANSVYPSIGRTLCFPLLLWQLATLQACSEQKFGCDSEGDAISPRNENNIESTVRLDFFNLTPASFTFWVSSVSGFLQLFVFIMIGPIADYSKYRKLFLNIASIAGSIASMLFIFYFDSSLYIIAGLTVIFGNIMFGLSNTIMYAYLPLLVESHWLVIDAVEKYRKSLTNKKSMNELYELVQSDMSQKGFAAGFCASVIVLLCGMIIIVLNPGDHFQVLEKEYGNVNKENQFDELWAQYVDQINLWYLIDIDNENNNYNYSQLLAIQFEYKNDAIGFVHGNRTGYNYNYWKYDHSNVSQLGIDRFVVNENVTLDKNTYVVSINLWFNWHNNYFNDSIAAIQFNLKDGSQTDIFGSLFDHYNYDADDATEVKSTIGNNYVLAGVYGSLTSNDNVISSLSFVFRDTVVKDQWSTVGYRFTLLLVGLWWFVVYMAMPFRLLLRRAGPPFPFNSFEIQNDSKCCQIHPKICNYLTFGFLKVYDSFKDFGEYPNLFLKLFCFFMYSDSLNTLTIAGVIFGRDELKASNTQLVILILELQITAGIGNIFFLKIEKLTKFDNKTMLNLHLLVVLIICLYGLCGFILPFGLVYAWELYIFGFFYGIVLGSLLSYSRTVYSQLIPIGRETEFFSLQQITDKGSSWIGPTIVAIIANSTTIRWSLVYVSLFVAIPIPLMHYVLDVEQGRKQSGRDLTDKIDQNE